MAQPVGVSRDVGGVVVVIVVPVWEVEDIITGGLVLLLFLPSAVGLESSSTTTTGSLLWLPMGLFVVEWKALVSFASIIVVWNRGWMHLE